MGASQKANLPLSRARSLFHAIGTWPSRLFPEISAPSSSLRSLSRAASRSQGGAGPPTSGLGGRGRRRGGGLELPGRPVELPLRPSQPPRELGDLLRPPEEDDDDYHPDDHPLERVSQRHMPCRRTGEVYMRCSGPPAASGRRYRYDKPTLSRLSTRLVTGVERPPEDIVRL